MTELVEFSEQHLDNTFLWMQNVELKKSFLLDKEIDRESHERWFKELKDDDSQKTFAIIFEGVHVGNLGIKNIDRTNRTAESWIYIGDTNYRGRGVAKNALMALTKNSGKDFHKLYARISDFNYQSLNTFLSSGYKIEGVLQKEVVFQGEYLNIYRLYILT